MAAAEAAAAAAATACDFGLDSLPLLLLLPLPPLPLLLLLHLLQLLLPMLLLFPMLHMICATANASMLLVQPPIFPMLQCCCYATKMSRHVTSTPTTSTPASIFVKGEPLQKIVGNIGFKFPSDLRYGRACLARPRESSLGSRVLAHVVRFTRQCTSTCTSKVDTVLFRRTISRKAWAQPSKSSSGNHSKSPTATNPYFRRASLDARTS